MILSFKLLSSDKKAVSPVIGVMLMIVVTIILAAAVSSYSSSMKSKPIAPQVSLTAEASLHKGYIHLEDLGGDTLDKRNLKVEIESGYPSKSGSVGAEKIKFMPDSNYLNPGSEARINFTVSEDHNSAIFIGNDISQTIKVGEPFRITIVDTASGQSIYSSQLTLLA